MASTTATKRKAADALEDQGNTPVPAAMIDGHLWASVTQYLDAQDLMSLRLTGNRTLPFYNPLFTSHLTLVMDRVPFFGSDKKYSVRQIRKWMHNRKRLMMKTKTGRNDNVHPTRVAGLVEHGFMNSVTELVISNCIFHRQTIGELAKIPTIKHVTISDKNSLPGSEEQKCKYNDLLVRENIAIVESLGRISSLETLDIELDCIVNGKHLHVLKNMKDLRSLRLRGFDLSEGMEHINSLTQLEHLHLCHQDTKGTSENVIPFDAFLSLSMNLKNLKSIHIENMNCLTAEQIKPLCQIKTVTDLTFQHCQEIDSEALSSIAAMSSLKTLNFINAAEDETPIFETEHLEHLPNLKELKTLTLMFVLIDQFDVIYLEGMASLETLNIGLQNDMEKKDFDSLCLNILPLLPSLKKLRIFGTEEMDFDLRCGKYDVDFRHFKSGGAIELD